MQRLALQPCQWLPFQFLVSTLLLKTKISLFFYVLAQTQITDNTTADSKMLRIKACATHATQLSSPSHL